MPGSTRCEARIINTTEIRRSFRIESAANHNRGVNVYQDRLKLAVEIARKAGEVTLNYFQDAKMQVDRKADNTPVTVADREAETLLRRAIREAFPADAILGEEFGDQPGTSGFRWVLDPIDGTKSFIHGVPLYSTLIGVEYQGKAVVGVIEVPALEERVYAAAGSGAWFVKGRQPPVTAMVSACDTLSDAALVSSEIINFDHIGRREVFFDLQETVRLVRTWGDGYGYLLVATGRVDIAIDPLLNPWDGAALGPVIEEAGGRFTDWRGRATFEGGNALGTNGRLHEAVLHMLRTQE